MADTTPPGASPALTPALDRVRKGELCSGCGGCALVSDGAVAMDRDAAGFLRPVQTVPVSDRINREIMAICPGLGQRLAPCPDAPRHNPIWGAWHGMWTGWAADPDLRHRAASGGALSAILTHLLESGRVDAVIEIAADPERPLGNRTVVSRSGAEVAAAAGSRYAPSAPLSELGPLIESGQRHAIVGKPCDIAALRALQDRDPRMREAFPVTVSFFCGGVPSGRGADALLEALGVPEEALAAFRYRGHGWPGRATATTTEGTSRSMGYHESWGNILSRHVQLRCKICPDGTGKAADIVCADAWETDDRGYPLFEEDDGVSLVVARTELGRAVTEEARQAGRLVIEGPFDPASLPRMQPGQYNRHRAVAARLTGLWLLGRPVPRFRGLSLLRAALGNNPWINLRNMMGTIKRARASRHGPAPATSAMDQATTKRS